MPSGGRIRTQAGPSSPTMNVETASKSPARFTSTMGLPFGAASNGPSKVGSMFASSAVPPWRTTCRNAVPITLSGSPLGSIVKGGSTGLTVTVGRAATLPSGRKVNSIVPTPPSFAAPNPLMSAIGTEPACVTVSPHANGGRDVSAVGTDVGRGGVAVGAGVGEPGLAHPAARVSASIGPTRERATRERGRVVIISGVGARERRSVKGRSSPR